MTFEHLIAAGEHPRFLFVEEQLRFDCAVNALVEGHTWEAMRDALERLRAFGVEP